MDNSIKNSVIQTVIEALILVQSGEKVSGFKRPIQIRLTKTILNCIEENGIPDFPTVSEEALQQLVTTWYTFLRDNEKKVLEYKVYCEYSIDKIAELMGGLKKQRIHAILKNVGEKLNGTLRRAINPDNY